MCGVSAHPHNPINHRQKIFVEEHLSHWSLLGTLDGVCRGKGQAAAGNSPTAMATVNSIDVVLFDLRVQNIQDLINQKPNGRFSSNRDNFDESVICIEEM